jgi:hypothetical protein
MTGRRCQWCGDPLEADARHNRLYHFPCWREVHNKSQRESQKRKRIRERIQVRFPHHTFNPMNMLGLDYVYLRLEKEIT